MNPGIGPRIKDMTGKEQNKNSSPLPSALFSGGRLKNEQLENSKRRYSRNKTKTTTTPLVRVLFFLLGVD